MELSDLFADDVSDSIEGRLIKAQKDRSHIGHKPDSRETRRWIDRRDVAPDRGNVARVHTPAWGCRVHAANFDAADAPGREELGNQIGGGSQSGLRSSWPLMRGCAQQGTDAVLQPTHQLSPLHNSALQ